MYRNNFWPATPRRVQILQSSPPPRSIAHTLCAAASAASISSHRHSLLQLLNIFEVLDGALEFPAIDGLGSLAGVLEADTQITATASSRFRRGNPIGWGVTDLERRVSISGSLTLTLYSRWRTGGSFVPSCCRVVGEMVVVGVVESNFQRSQLCIKFGLCAKPRVAVGAEGAGQPRALSVASLMSAIT